MLNFMNKTMTVGGQRITVNPFSDYYFEFIRSLFDSEGQLLMDLGRHSTIIEMTAEVIAPGFPKKLYRKSGERYYWNGTVEEFGELLNGLYLAYWEYQLDAANETNNVPGIEQAKAQIEIVRPSEPMAEQDKKIAQELEDQEIELRKLQLAP
jgi:hypothetical protein